MNHFILNIKSFFIQHGEKIICALLAFLSPIHPLLIAAFVMASMDFVTGIAAAKKKQVKIESKKMQKKVFDLLFYLVAIILAYYFEYLFKDMIQFPLCRLVAFIILSVEFWSNMENLSVLTGLPLNKQAFFELVNKIRNKDQNGNNGI